MGDVMREMVKIPYGETRTYGELASSEKERVPENPPVLPAENPEDFLMRRPLRPSVATGTEALNSSAVAVGQACGRNRVPVVVPCHRVVGDSIGSYAYGAKVKEKLLKLEK
ncbi:MAG: methylated-DNA--[protein]-cysteine S-methyltransferase [Candidatus Nanohalobium sp.]